MMADDNQDEKPALTDEQVADLMMQEAMAGEPGGDAESQETDRVELSEEERKAIRSQAGEGKAFEEIPVEVSAILGTADVEIVNLLKVGRGAVIELNRTLGEKLELRCRGRRIAEGEITIKENNKLAISISQMLPQRTSDDD